MRQGGLRLNGLTKESKKNKPLISVITVVYNGRDSIEGTINSVLSQTYENIEYIVIDGNSTDSTIDIIERYGNKIDYWISESDKGVYHAMNKGIALASGDYIALLNSGDWYEINTCAIVAERILLNKADIYYGMVRVYRQDKTLLCIKGNTIDNISNEMIAHPTCFISSDIYAVQMYNTKYISAADYDFVLRLKISGYSFSFIEEIFANFKIGGISSSKVGHRETNRIMHIYKFQSFLSFFLKNIYLTFFK
ncbi:putative teichuronic acid biosynthesis glycosyltransferase TuaG [mine drainage metagenome]|uniref:Putative teichuronic acid biosynthesis glycosyltransferase TuaG n=1 Tax=mine drainage metagenome TaxID=410659 RepID=A0A1J5PIL7_9ZZZZ